MITDLICLHDIFGYELPESDTMSSSFLLTRKAMVHQTPTQPSPPLTGCRPNLKVYASGGRSSETGWSCQVRAHQSGNRKDHSGFNLCGEQISHLLPQCFYSFFHVLVSLLIAHVHSSPQTATLASRRESGRRRPRWSWKSGTPGRTSSWRKPKPTTGTGSVEQSKFSLLMRVKLKINHKKRHILAFLIHLLPGDSDRSFSDFFLVGIVAGVSLFINNKTTCSLDSQPILGILC